MKINAVKTVKKEFSSEVIKPSIKTGYQKNAIVSSEIIRKNTGTATLFAFDKGQGLSAHTAPFDALAVILDGKAEIFIGGRKYLVAKDEMIIMPAGTPHALKASEKFKMLLVMIKS
ncbi:MAG: cupin domain-containing protein [Elusimicrobia bacterium]|nr:cupin domain-containing protein [Elusimicrobiota bacterium]